MAPGSVISKRRVLERIAALMTLALVAAACGSAASANPQASAPAASTAQPSAAATPAGPKDLILATTTSTQDSGLLDVLVPAFQQATGYVVKTVAVGSGQALDRKSVV